jgi:hypothetical protein
MIRGVSCKVSSRSVVNTGMNATPVRGMMVDM